MGSAVGSASRQVPAQFSRDDPNPGDLNKSHALRGSKSGMPDPRRKQKLQALQQKKEVARLAAVKFEDNWLEVLEYLGCILSAEHIWRIYLLLEGASKSQGLAGELNHAANIHHANRRLDLEDPKLCSASKQRAVIEERLHALLKLDETYHSISDIYNSTKKSYAEILEEGLESRDLVRQVLVKSGMENQLKETAAARVRVIKAIERFRDLLREERTRSSMNYPSPHQTKRLRGLQAHASCPSALLSRLPHRNPKNLSAVRQPIESISMRKRMTIRKQCSP
ncbi:hypothetical protein [Pseudomonas sp. HY13-MNA-CIBAN-0226]|uniref:hypothetical protein n=1 Tax=Pseudomonas sp. HY13-MNA-CIBAN-0226 TaxID=3140473 RepID=UPI00332AC557